MEDNKYKKDGSLLFEGKQEKLNWNIKPYLAVALLIFLVFCCCVTVFFAFYRFDGVVKIWNTLMRVLQPITIGLVIAYLINPIMNFYEKYLLRLLKGRMKSDRKAEKTARSIATGGAIVTFILILGLLVEMMLPQLIRSISGMVTTLPDQAKAFVEWFNQYVKSENKLALAMEEALVQGTAYLQTWVKDSLLPDLQTYLTSLTTGVISVFKVLLNFLIGLIVAVYVLMSKEHFIGQSKKLIYAIFKPQTGNVIIETARKSHEIFGGFISGKILDSAIIGVLCYIVLVIMKMPYALLVSAFVGITNIIPFFGPFIGAIPSFVIIVLADPLKGLYFLIVILVLQQLDGNVIGPKILGDSTGLSSFWVVFAIMVGGGLCGVAGMILGVPTFAVIYYIISKVVNHCLHRKRLSEDTTDYIRLESVDRKTKKIIYPKEEVKQEEKEEKQSK